MANRVFLVRVNDVEHRVVVELDQTGKGISARVGIDGTQFVSREIAGTQIVENTDTATQQRVVVARSEKRQGVLRTMAASQGFTAKVECETEDSARLRGSGKAGSSDDGLLVAPMPGRVVKVWASVGDTLAQGDRLFTVEAMKMENDITSPCGGTVQRISADTGDTVETGAELALISSADEH